MDGRELKEFRKEQKMTRKELSIKTGIPVSTLKAYENGYRTLKKIDFLEIEVANSHFFLKLLKILSFDFKKKRLYLKILFLSQSFLNLHYK